MPAHIPPADSPHLLHHVPPSRPLVWLGMAWEDFKSNPLASLSYGLLVSLMGAIVLLFNRHPFMVASCLTGFLLIGPILTIGLCELSRRREQGEFANFETSLSALRHNRGGLFGFANRLVLLGVGWMLMSAVLLQVALGDVGPSVADTVWGGAWTRLSGDHLLLYFGAWLLLSAVVFAISVVSIPMILDLSTDAGTAMRTSLRVTQRDLPAMVVWAVLILLLVAAGFATLLVGMVVVFPLLGHATWHAYRELVH